MPHPVFLLYVLVKNIVSCMQAVLFLGRVNFEMRLQRKQQLGAGMCFNSYITYFDTGVLITCSPFPTSQRTRLWFSSHFFPLCNFWFFSLPLLGFAPPSPSFSHPTTQIWQLHATFTVISAAPHLFLFCLQTVIKPEGGQSLFPEQFTVVPIDSLRGEARAVALKEEHLEDQT